MESLQRGDGKAKGLLVSCSSYLSITGEQGEVIKLGGAFVDDDILDYTVAANPTSLRCEMICTGLVIVIEVVFFSPRASQRVKGDQKCSGTADVAEVSFFGKL